MTQLFVEKLSQLDAPGLVGAIRFNSVGARDAPLVLRQFQASAGDFLPVGTYSQSQILFSAPPQWGTLHGNVPKDSRGNTIVWIAAGLGTFGTVITAIVVYFRLRQLKNRVTALQWRVDVEELKDDGGSQAKQLSRLSLSSQFGGGERPFRIALYRGKRVCLFDLFAEVCPETREVLLEVKTARDITSAHDNLAYFHGVSTGGKLALVNEYLIEGTLQQLVTRVTNDRICIALSLLIDILGALDFLHRSAVGVHGRLRSGVCLVDSRFSCKVADVGLPSLRGRWFVARAPASGK